MSPFSEERHVLAGHISAPGRIELVDIPEPQLDDRPGLNGGGRQIIFQPECTCLCGSDIPFFMWSDEVPRPEIGHSLHEMIGSVIATNGQRFRPGDRVLVVPNNQQGLFERYAVSEDQAIPIDRRVPEEHALLAQPLGTVIFALKKLPAVLDKDVVVVGQGAIGQLFNAALRNLGAREIIGVDLIPERLATSSVMGATATICNAAIDPVKAVRELTDGRMADIVIEAVGHAEQAMNLCIDLAGYGGRILYFGVPPHELDGIRWREMFIKNITVHTSVGPDFRRDFPLAMRWIGEGRVDVAPIITHRYPLADIQTAFEVYRDRPNGSLKVLVEFPSWAGKQCETTAMAGSLAGQP